MRFVLETNAGLDKKWVEKLTKDGWECFCKVVSAGSTPGRMLDRTRILLKAVGSEYAGGGRSIDRETDQFRYACCYATPRSVGTGAVAVPARFYVATGYEQGGKPLSLAIQGTLYAPISPGFNEGVRCVFLLA
jgi:hypothetical protein